MLYKQKLFISTDLKGIDFADSTFHHCSFVDAEFKFTGFNRCHFVECDFSGSLFGLVTFSDCEFPDSKLSYLDFSTTHVDHCDFSGAIMHECILQQLKDGSKQERKKFDLTTCRFERTDLLRSAFAWCNLTNVSFKEANLEGAVFERCLMKATDLSNCNLSGVGFGTSTINQVILTMDGFVQLGNSQGFILK